MTETDNTKRPLQMPEKFIPYLDKYRIYRMFKDILEDLITTLPRDHLKQMKIFLSHHLHSTNDIDRVMMLVDPVLKIDIKKLIRELIKSLGYYVITRRCVMDKYETHDDYKPGCVDPVLMAQVTRNLTLKEPVQFSGWLMFDHPCTLREARCLQQEGVLPTVTIVLTPTPLVAPAADDVNTPPRNFFQQDFQGLKYAYKATLKDVYVDPTDDVDKLAAKVYNGIHAAVSGAQGPGQAFSVVGAPSTYRVLLIGPTGAGRYTQAHLLARHFGLVFLSLKELIREAKGRDDEIGQKLRAYGPNTKIKSEIVLRRLLQKDCIDNGWVLICFPTNTAEFEAIYGCTTPPNRIIIMNTDMESCKKHLMAVAVDWCTGKPAAPGSGPRVVQHPGISEEEMDAELDTYFSETLAELRAAAGITAVEIDIRGNTIEEIQVKIQAAVIAAPSFDIINAQQLQNVRGD